MNRRIRIQQLAPHDRDEWQRLYYQHQQYGRRRRLKALKAVWDGETLQSVARRQGIRLKTLEGWLDTYLHGGFNALLAPQKRPRAQVLNATHQKVLRYIVLHKAPADYGIDTYAWTGRAIQDLLQQKWQIMLGLTRIYELLYELGLSHQRAHRDYGPHSAAERAAFVAQVNAELERATQETALVCMDEFAL
jgi:transposase